MQVSPGAGRTHAKAKPPIKTKKDDEETQDNPLAASEDPAEDANDDDESIVAAMMKVDWMVSTVHTHRHYAQTAVNWGCV